MTILQTIAAALNWNIRVNENFEATSPAGLFAKKASTTTGLTLGYYGGILDGVSYADGTHLLTASTTRYVVVARATGVVSSATGTTNWNDSTNYMRMGIAVVGVSTITTWTDWRQFGVGSGGGGTFTGGTLTSALNEAPAVTIASAATVNIGAAAANTINVTGTTTITAFDTIASGAVRRVIFAGILTLTHNVTSLILPTGSNITTAAGDVAEFVSLGSGNWKCIAYTRANGQALASAGGSATWGAITGTLASQTDLQAALDAKGAAGIPQNSQSTAYTLVLADANKHLLHPSADTTARIFTIPANSSVAFPIGTAVTFVNQNAAGIITIAITTDTMRLAGAGTTGSRSLAANGIATAIKITSTEWLISGTGLT